MDEGPSIQAKISASTMAVESREVSRETDRCDIRKLPRYPVFDELILLLQKLTRNLLFVRDP